MADFSNIYNEIDANVNANGQQKITGPILNKTLKDMLQDVDSKKQDTLVAGQNITISGNVISATGGGSGEEYYAGNGLELNGNVFSVKPSDIAGHGLGEDGNGKLAVMPYDIAGHGLTTEGDALLAVDPSGLAGHGLEVDGDGRIEINPGVVQEKLQAGSNITIYGNTISATDTNTTYSAGQGLELNGTTFAVKAGSGLGFDANGNLVNTGGGGGGTTYTAGDGIEIDQNDAINAKLGNGLQLDGSNNIEINPSVVATQSDLSGKQNTLQAGSNIQINGNVISATDTNTTYSAGSGLNLNGTTFSVNTNAIQEKLTAGQNITISGNVISASGGSGGNYLPLDGGTLQDTTGSTQTRLQLISPNGSPAGSVMEISSNYGYGNITIGTAQTDQTVLQNDLVQVHNATSGKTLNITSEGFSDGSVYHASLPTLTQDEILATQSDVNTAVSGKQDILTAGSGITIQNNVISATGGSGSSYSAGNGIDITNNTISVDATDLDGTGLTTNQNGELEVDTSVIQGKLTAGSGISIQNNVISATGGSGSSLWTSGTGTDSLFAPGTGSDIDYVDPEDPSQGINNQSESTGTRSIATGSFTKATGSYSAAFGENTSASGYASAAFGQGADASGYLSFASGYGTGAYGSQSAAFGNQTYASNESSFAAGSYLQTSNTNHAVFGTWNDASYPYNYLFTIGNGEMQEIYHEYGTPSWEPNPDDPESTDSWTEYIEARKNAVDIKTNGDVFIEDIGGYDGTNSSNATRLQDVISGKQDTLTAGSGISIQNNVISATGGGGSGLWTSGTGTNSVMSPGAFQANGNNSVSAGDYTRSNGTSSIALGTSTTTTGLSSVAIGANSTAAGSYSVALGHGLGAVNSDETALGKFNNYIDTGTTAEKTFFTVGNGTSNNTKSNVLEVKQNDDIYVSGIGGFDGTNASSADTLQDVIAGKQDTLVAGSNITISGNVISATGGGGGSYTASHGIDIINDAISVDVSDLNGTGLIADHQRGILEVDFTTVQGKLTAGSGITISGNTISATGGSGNYLPLTGGQLQANPSDAETVLDVAAPDSTAAVSISADTIDSKLAISADKENAGISDGDTFRTVFTNTGEINVDAKTVNPLDPTDITSTTYTLVLPQKNDTIATLSDIQGAGSSYSAGTGINIDSNNVISNTAPDPGVLVAGTGNNSLMMNSFGGSANGAYSLALGAQSHADGAYSLAAGQWASASRSRSIAIGDNATSAADYSIAVGQFSNASGDGSIALGQYGETKNTNETGLGKYNNSINTGTTAEKTQFTVGNGTADNARSNLIEAKQNNDIYVLGIGGFDGTNASSALTLQTVVNSKQNQLVSGVDVKTINGQSIVGGGNLVISGGSYTAGQAIDITNGAISVDYGSGLGLGTNGELQVEWSEGPTALAGSGLSANTQNGQLDVDFTSVQGKLTAGTGITISGNTISATGGGGSCLWSQGSGQNSLLGPGATGADGDYSMAAGYISDAQADYSIALSGGTVVYSSDPQNPINAQYGVAIGSGARVNGEHGLAFMGGTAIGNYGVAIGNSANANEMYSTALTGSTAAGNYSFAASTGVAEAHYSTALSGATVYGEGSLAAGFESNVYGYCSAALGYKLSTYDQADGTSDTDPNAGEVALGRYNYSEQGIVFTVGCGYFDDSDPDNPQEVRENAVAIDSDGKIFLKGLGGYTGTSTSGCTDLVSFLNNL